VIRFTKARSDTQRPRSDPASESVFPCALLTRPVGFHSSGDSMRIPEQTGHRFRTKAATDSGAIRPLIPGMPACHSGGTRPPPVKRVRRWMT